MEDVEATGSGVYTPESRFAGLRSNPTPPTSPYPVAYDAPFSQSGFWPRL